MTTATDPAACGLALKFRKAEPVGVLRDIFQILQKIVIFLSYLIIAKKRTQIILTVLISDIVSLFFLH